MSRERGYRLLLLCYPRAYRQQRSEEMLEVLLAGADRGGSWSTLSESASLVQHGLAQRLRRPSPRRLDPRPGALAGVLLLGLLAVLGARQLVTTGLASLGVDGYPAEWSAVALWVDPRWPVHAAWLATGAALLLGRCRLVVVLAWTAAALHVWLVISAISGAVPWPGDVGPHSYLPGGGRETSWLVLSLAGAVLVGGPRGTQRARAAVPGLRWWIALGVGFVAGAAASVVLLVEAERSGVPSAAVIGGGAGPLTSLAVSGLLLTLGLVRSATGRRAVIVLAALSAVPLGVRWPGSTVVLGAAMLAFLSGYAVAVLTRGPRSALTGAQSARPVAAGSET